jgi:hypothetical protein
MAQVWTGHSTDFSFQNFFFVLWLNFQWGRKKNSELSISLSFIRLKIYQIAFIKSCHWGRPNSIQSVPKYLYNFYSWFKWFFSETIVQ